MLQIEDAYNLVLSHARHKSTENIELTEALGRVLAEDVLSDLDMPPFNKAAVDGYACRMADLKGGMEVLEVVKAGQAPTQTIRGGKCTKIMTGAPVPEGADCVVMVEDTETDTDGLVYFRKEKTKSNIAIKAEDVKVGDKVLSKGTLIKPQHIAVMAAVGYAHPRVAEKVKVGVISTGDELVEPNEMPSPSQIRNSNAFQLITQIERAGAIPSYIGIARDNEEDTYAKISLGLKENDVVLLTGGVSMGDFDFIPKVFQTLNVDIKFETLAVQPGKPTVFGISDDKLIFGLPGNPVSSFNIFELLVRPVLMKSMGHEFRSAEIYMPMGKEYSRKRTQRASYIPVYLKEGKVFPLDYHGSAHIFALNEADGVIRLEIGKARLEEGEIVDVRQI